MRIHADPDLDSSKLCLCRHKKLNFYIEKYSLRHTSTYVGTTAVLKGWRSVESVNFGRVTSYSWIRILISNKDPDPLPEEPQSMRIRKSNTKIFRER
jgi:hypothetical protein